MTRTRRTRTKPRSLTELAKLCTFEYKPIVFNGHHDLEYLDALPYPLRQFLKSDLEAYFVVFDIWEEAKRGTPVEDILNILRGMNIEYRAQIEDWYKGIRRKDA